MKYLYIAFLFLLVPAAKATTTGTGCRVGDYVYINYIGNAPAYHPSNPQKRFYTKTTNIPIYWGYGMNQHQGYRCGYINYYPASSYYDYEKKQNIPIPEEREYTVITYGGCVLSNTLGGSVLNEGDYVSYTYNKTGKCGTNPNDLPFDDYIWVLMLAAGGAGAYFIYKNKLQLI